VSNGQGQRSSIFSGLLLILLGVLFLLARFDPNLGIWHVFWRYWPIVIILWGLAKLVDHLGAQHAAQRRPPLLNGGEAALLVLVFFVLAGMGLYSKIREKHPDLNFDVGFFNHETTQSQELPATTIPAGSHVVLTTIRGSITAHAGDGNDLLVSVNETAEGASESSARDRMKNLQVVIEQTSDGYSVHPVNLEDTGGHVTVDLDVTLPKKVSVTANSDRGDIRISGVAGAVTATTQHGDIEVHDVGSDVSAKMTKGDTRVTGVAGNVSLAGHGNEIEISEVKGNAAVDGDFFGPIRVRSVPGTVRYRSQRADLTLVGVRGRLELDSGQIEISDVSGPAKLVTHKMDIEVENVSGHLDIADTKGDIKVRFSQPPREDINVADDSGEVDLTLPSNSSFEISAISQSGEVQSEFEDSSLKLQNDNGTGRLSGKIGTGGPKIHITTSYGTLYLRKSS
jgi:putative adhesin/cell wall-active antibiotic response 4TMS protein YvqF